MGKMKQKQNAIKLGSFENPNGRTTDYWVDITSGWDIDQSTPIAIGRTQLGVIKTAQGRLNQQQRDLARLRRAEERRIKREARSK